MSTSQQKVKVIDGQAESWVDAIAEIARHTADHMEADAFLLLVKDGKGNSAVADSAGDPDRFYLLIKGIEYAAERVGMTYQDYIDHLKAAYLESIAQQESPTVH